MNRTGCGVPAPGSTFLHVFAAEQSKTDRKQLLFPIEETTDPFCCVMPTTPALAINVDAIVVFKRCHLPQVGSICVLN